MIDRVRRFRPFVHGPRDALPLARRVEHRQGRFEVRGSAQRVQRNHAVLRGNVREPLGLRPSRQGHAEEHDDGRGEQSQHFDVGGTAVPFAADGNGGLGCDDTHDQKISGVSC